jgi:carbonic anhydrase/acetyltransferase-like protein (isoleucine patch superfamily)
MVRRPAANAQGCRRSSQQRAAPTIATETGRFGGSGRGCSAGASRAGTALSSLYCTPENHKLAIYRLGERGPEIHPSAYVHENAVIIGLVTIGPRASVWPGAVLRGDNEPIVIGEETNVQDGCVLHADPGIPLTVGARVSIGHLSMLHGCTIGDGTLIGIQAVLLNQCVIGKNCLIGAAALITERKQFADETMVVGAPARAIRKLEPAEIERLALNAQSYVARAALFHTELVRLA